MTPFIEADWPAPPGVKAYTTTRLLGCSEPPYDTFNLGPHVGDDPQAVDRNREILTTGLPGQPRVQWLTQVHGTQVVSVDGACCDQAPKADAALTREHGVACSVMTADCLPVLFCDRKANVVAAAHAGWRGLADGVLEQTVLKMACPPEDVLAWLGPAIGPTAFEVGPEVRDAFRATLGEGVDRCFRPGAGDRLLADLFALARLQLTALGVSAIYGGGICTYSNPETCYSYRRDGRTGRMASLIYLI